MIEWCIDILYEVWNDVKMETRYIISKKRSIVLELLG